MSSNSINTSHPTATPFPRPPDFKDNISNTPEANAKSIEKRIRNVNAGLLVGSVTGISCLVGLAIPILSLQIASFTLLLTTIVLMIGLTHHLISLQTEQILLEEMLEKTKK